MDIPWPEPDDLPDTPSELPAQPARKDSQPMMCGLDDFMHTLLAEESELPAKE